MVQKKRVQPETIIKKAVKQYLHLRGWFNWHNLQGLGCYAGLPDITAIKNGITLHLEIKTPKGRQNENQKEFENMIKQYGGFDIHYFVIRSVDDLQDRLIEIERGN